MKRIVIILLGVVTVRLLSAEHEHEGPVAGTNAVPLTTAVVNQLMEEMRTNHPAVRAAAARAEAATANTNAIRVWEDPKFIFGGSVYSSKGMNPAEEGNLIYGIEQKLPLFGRARAAREMARTEAETEEARSISEFQTRRRDLAMALFKLAGDSVVLGIGSQDLTWLETMISTAEARYRSGDAAQLEVLRLQNERSKRVNQLRTENLHLDHSRFAVNRLLNRDLQSSLPQFELPDIAGSLRYSQRLVDLAVANDPRLRVANGEIKQAEARVAVARKSRLPEVGLGVDGRQYGGDGGFRQGTFTLNFSLPWFNESRYRSDVVRDRSRLRAAELDAIDKQQGVREEVHQLTVEIDAARREALLYRDEIQPRSEQALASAEVNWRAGRGAFNDVMEARRMLIEARSMYAVAVSRQYQLMSELVLCCGLGDLEALQSVGARLDPGSDRAVETLNPGKP